MRIVDISELIGNEKVNISSILAINQAWREGQSYVMKSPRKQSALLWFCGCSGVFKSVGGEKTVAPHYSLVYIPEGAMYEVEFHNCECLPTTVLIQFCLNDGESFVLSDRITLLETVLSNDRVISVLKKLVAEYSLPSKSQLKMKRDLYGLLSLICESEQQKFIGKRGFNTIEKGIEYLQKDERQELSVDEIARLCFISPAYFRRLFREFSGMSPSEYRSERRIERAKDLLEHSELSIEALSELLGYSDPSYFCRIFKKKTGLSPSEYQKISKN